MVSHCAVDGGARVPSTRFVNSPSQRTTIARSVAENWKPNMQTISVIRRSDKLLKIVRGNGRERVKSLRETSEINVELATELTTECDDIVALEALMHIALSRHRVAGDWFGCTLPQVANAFRESERELQDCEAMAAAAADSKMLTDNELGPTRLPDPVELGLRDQLLELEDQVKVAQLRANYVRDQLKAAISDNIGITGVAHWPPRWNGAGRYFQLERDR